MSTKIKGLPPRVAIRIKDSATGSYPSISRIGDDSRTGRYNTLYNDLDTIDFVEQGSAERYNTKNYPPFDLTVNPYPMLNRHPSEP